MLSCKVSRATAGTTCVPARLGCSGAMDLYESHGGGGQVLWWR